MMPPDTTTREGRGTPTTLDRWHTLRAIDFDKHAAATYKTNFPDVDVTCGSVADHIDGLPYADVILGGPPCQPHSHAGKRLASKDTRDCGPDFVAAVAKVKPRMFLMENVDGLLTSEGGRYFQRLYGSMEDAGYVPRYEVQDAVGFGVPQFRSRLWVWGIRRDLYVDGIRHAFPRPTHAWPPPQREVLFGEALSPGVTVGQALGLDDGVIHRRRGQGMIERHGERRDSSVHEPAPLLNAGVARQFHLIQSHADPAQTIDKPGPTLRSGGAGHDGCCVRLMVKHPRQTGAKDYAEIAEPCRTLTGTRCDEIRLEEKSTPLVKWRWSDAWKEKHPPIELGLPCPSIIRNWNKGLPYGAVKVKQTADGLWVRRLHVLECARLQGMPDDFAWLPGLPVTHAYKIIGNGWATTHAAAFSRALAMADPDSRTVIDLFCGGGLGAVGWHQRYWTYSPELVEAP